MPLGPDNAQSAAKAQPSPVQANRTILLLGPSGSGKTVFALQNLIAAIESGQRGIFLSFDEAPARIRDNAASFGWDVPSLENQRRLLLHARVRPHIARAGHFAVEAVLAALTSEIHALQIRHVVLDGLHVMLALLDTRPARLQAAFRLRDWIHENNLSAVLTYCVGLPEQPLGGAFGPEVIESIADCVVALDNGPGAERGRRLRFIRYRCGELPPIDYPIRITSTGVEVLAPGPSEGDPHLSSAPELVESRRVLSTGLRQLHCFLEAKQAEFDLLLERRSLDAQPGSADCSEGGIRTGITG